MAEDVCEVKKLKGEFNVPVSERTRAQKKRSGEAVEK